MTGSICDSCKSDGSFLAPEYGEKVKLKKHLAWHALIFWSAAEVEGNTSVPHSVVCLFNAFAPDLSSWKAPRPSNLRSKLHRQQGPQPFLHLLLSVASLLNHPPPPVNAFSFPLSVSQPPRAGWDRANIMGTQLALIRPAQTGPRHVSPSLQQPVCFPPA